VHSSTNADVLRAQNLDVVVVVSPMSATRFPLGAPDALLRWSSHRRLDREQRRLERAGTVVVRIEPGGASMNAMGLQPMSNDRSDRVTAAAYAETVQLIARREISGGLLADVDAVPTG
jgi:NTE family protein